MSDTLWIPAIYNPLLGPCCLQPTLASPLFLVTPLILLVIQGNPVSSPARPEEARRAVSKERKGDRRRALPEERHHPDRPAIRVKIEGYVTTIPFRHDPHLRGGLPDGGVESPQHSPLWAFMRLLGERSRVVFVATY